MLHDTTQRHDNSRGALAEEVQVCYLLEEDVVGLMPLEPGRRAHGAEKETQRATGHVSSHVSLWT